MRRWLPVVLLIAVAGLSGLLLLRQSNRANPIEIEQAQAPVERAPDREVLEGSLPTERAVPRAVPASAAGTQSDPLAGQLVVRVLGKSSKGPVENVRVILSLSPPGSGQGHRNIRGTDGDLENSPITGADGVVRFKLTPARNCDLKVRNEDERFRPPEMQVPDSVSVSGHSKVSFERPTSIRVIGRPGNQEVTSVPVPGLTAGEVRELVLEIEDGLDGLVVGQVICAETREPVAGARVRILTAGQTRREWRRPGPEVLTTGNDGRFKLPFALRAEPLLCVEADGYGLRYMQLDALHSDEAHTQLVRISRAATLDARVLDARGAPIPDVRINLSVDGVRLCFSEADEQGFFPKGGWGNLPRDESWRATTGADGRARIEGLPPRVEISAEAVKDGKQLWREPGGLNLQPGESREVEWRIGAGTTLNGRVVDQDGKPVGGFQILADKLGSSRLRSFQRGDRDRMAFKTEADSDGRFTLSDLPAGKWAIGPDAENRRDLAPIPESIELADEPSIDFTLHVSRGLFVRGRVVSPAGEPVRNAWLIGSNEHELYLENQISRGDGTFTFGPIGTGTISLSATSIGMFAPSDPVRARAGDEGVVLQLNAGGSIRGLVVDARTRAACEAQLYFSPEENNRGPLTGGTGTSTQADGTFSMTGLAPGRLSVTAFSTDGRFAQQARIEVGPGIDPGELLFELSPGGKLRLAYDGNEPMLFVTIKSQGVPVNFGTSVHPRRPVEHGAPAGSLVLELRKTHDGPASTKAVELKPGETKEVLLTDED